ncbi:DUF3488 domain-containing transglutaminase family protein [Rhodoferax sp. 4810]|uniref:DUF3488 domain-containing transglutaminase family protein n=1 Tax=Thiospirillum jenense TaxID=1653858 RepID=A0A839HB88_9GAMM|nr:DUF3488 and transglutaminase-like domain-containing protein [Thiospirillum jenense]MBB1073978.1 DUF3488 domain-containing transglutaminase family protein [Rhodoferax jenense]MBB1125854.1 DUF3488 domain-containing transglutaminase family protein [Thiospirillum jenense]
MKTPRFSIPDVWQTTAMSGLLLLATIPLLPYLHMAVIVFILTALLLRTVTLRWSQLQPNKWLLGLFAIAGVLTVGASYLALAGQDAGTAFLLTMMALKSLEIRTHRDLYVLSALLTFLLVIAFLFDSTPLFTAYLVIILIANIVLLADMNSHYSLRLALIKPRLQYAGRITTTLIAQAVPLTILLFFLFPRLETPLWSFGLSDTRARTGMSDTLELGHISELVLSGEIAFHARFEQPLSISPAQLYWRGPVLWKTDGRRWQPATESQLRSSTAKLVETANLLNYSVILEPTAQQWLFALDMPFTAPPHTRLLPGDFRLLADKPINDVRVYQLRSALNYRIDGLSLAERTLALQLPPTITPRMQALAMQWRTESLVEHPTANKTTIDNAVVTRALRHFNQEPFYYTLQPPPLGDNPVDTFLFSTRAGFCEHYASSFVLLMRLADIPARIVLGYLGAEYNPLGGHYLIRQSDAHAWAEVWIDTRGWVRIDPTAAIAPERINVDSSLAQLGADAPARFNITHTGMLRLAHQLRLFTDAIDAGWKNWIVGFSTKRQQHLLSMLGLSAWREAGLVIIMMTGGAIIMLLVHGLLTRRRLNPDPIAQCYLQLCQKLARAGYPRFPNEGPRDYLARIAMVQPHLAPALMRIQALYLPLRFGKPITDSGQRIALQQLVRTIRPRREKSQLTHGLARAKQHCDR